MPFVPVPNTAFVSIRYNWDGQNVENGIYVSAALGGEMPELSAIATVVHDSLVDVLLPIQASTLILREIFVRDLTTATSGQFTLPGDPTDIGGSASPSQPNNVSLSISFRTAKTGRSFRGRNFVLGLTEGAVTNSGVGLGTVASYVDAYNGFRTAINAINGVWVVVSKKSGGVDRTEGLATPVITALVVNSVVDSQRRRLPGRGR